MLKLMNKVLICNTKLYSSMIFYNCYFKLSNTCICLCVLVSMAKIPIKVSTGGDYWQRGRGKIWSPRGRGMSPFI